VEATGQRYSTGIRILIYIGSFLIPLIGLIIFILFMGRDPESKLVGRNALIAAIAGVVLGCICGFAGGGLGVLGGLSGSGT
jgi:hypothetical protein